ATGRWLPSRVWFCGRRAVRRSPWEHIRRRIQGPIQCRALLRSRRRPWASGRESPKRPCGRGCATFAGPGVWRCCRAGPRSSWMAPTTRSPRPVFVFAALREKPVYRMLEQLLPLGRALVLTAPRSSRTPPMDPHELARRAADRIEAVFVEPAAERAVEKAKALAGPEGVVCVCGSLYLVGEVRGLLAGEGSFERE